MSTGARTAVAGDRDAPLERDATVINRQVPKGRAVQAEQRARAGVAGLLHCRFIAGIEEQTRRVLDNLGAVLAEAGLGYGDVVKCSVFLTNMDDFPAFDAAYAHYFGASAPARSTLGVAALPKGAAAKYAVLLGDEKANARALDADTGKELWSTKLDDHPIIAGVPT